MFHICDCTVRVRFTDEEVVQDLLDNEIITEEEAENYIPSKKQIQEYAWQLIENDDGEYGDITVD